MPISLGPDGPSLGGFVCPFVVIAADRWKIGQRAPGDKLRFAPVNIDDAAVADALQPRPVASGSGEGSAPRAAIEISTPTPARHTEGPDRKARGGGQAGTRRERVRGVRY